MASSAVAPAGDILHGLARDTISADGSMLRSPMPPLHPASSENAVRLMEVPVNFLLAEARSARPRPILIPRSNKQR